MTNKNGTDPMPKVQYGALNTNHHLFYNVTTSNTRYF